MNMHNQKVHPILPDVEQTVKLEKQSNHKHYFKDNWKRAVKSLCLISLGLNMCLLIVIIIYIPCKKTCHGKLD